MMKLELKWMLTCECLNASHSFDFFEELECESSPAFCSTHSASLKISPGFEKAYHLGHSVFVFRGLSASSSDSESRSDLDLKSSSEQSSSFGGSILSSTPGCTPHTAMNQHPSEIQGSKSPSSPSLSKSH